MRTALLVLALLAPVLAQDEGVQKGSTTCRALRPAADPALQALLKAYEFTEPNFAWTLRETRKGEKVTQYWLSFPSAVKTEIPENNTVWCRYWQPNDGATRRPAAVLLHWLGGNFDALEIVGLRMAESGIATLMLYMPGYGPRRPKEGPKEKLGTKDMDAMIATLRQAVLDVRRAGDWLASRPDVEASRVGLVGISLGAVVGSLTAGVDDRFGRSVFLIGGGDLAAIVMNGSKETAAAKARLEKDGFTVDQLRGMWKNIDPITFASRVRPEEILLINAEADEVIPKECTLRLGAAMGGPELRWFKGGHYALLFQLGKALKDITGHLRERTAW
ncbi:MAG TPA: alpha/beta hydrolase family protein [Planctomycetota bacterium]|nr:alpha/beta hydrolase family protein [Planctomycetota bacterium]